MFNKTLSVIACSLLFTGCANSGNQTPAPTSQATSISNGDGTISTRKDLEKEANDLTAKGTAKIADGKADSNLQEQAEGQKLLDQAKELLDQAKTLAYSTPTTDPAP